MATGPSASRLVAARLASASASATPGAAPCATASRAADAEAPRLLMPAAELFGQWAVAAAAAEARGGPPTAATA
eukprot:scaffold128364_cov54-Phaeocystis_antarctica.AAC.1